MALGKLAQEILEDLLGTGRIISPVSKKVNFRSSILDVGSSTKMKVYYGLQDAGLITVIGMNLDWAHPSYYAVAPKDVGQLLMMEDDALVFRITEDQDLVQV